MWNGFVRKCEYKLEKLYLPCEKKLGMVDRSRDQTQDIFFHLACKQISRGSPK